MGEIIVSGMRPTGALHLGHYACVIKNWVELQKGFDCFFFVADWHALTSCYDSIKVVHDARIEYVRGWLACGIDPNRSVIYQQSLIPEILYLSQIFLSLTPPGWADRSPSWKDHLNNYTKKLDNLGFYTYPVLQAADIAIARGNYVPVGEDQITHVEISREIIRKFNRLYATNLPEPAPKLTPISKLPGPDGKKMSSSSGNVITLRETEKSLPQKISKIKTDDQRGGVDKPGNPDNCMVYEYHKVFSKKEMCADVSGGCRAGKLSCGECKQRLASGMKAELLPIAERMGRISDQECLEVLKAGTEKARPIIANNWNELRERMGF